MLQKSSASLSYPGTDGEKTVNLKKMYLSKLSNPEFNIVRESLNDIIRHASQLKADLAKLAPPSSRPPVSSCNIDTFSSVHFKKVIQYISSFADSKKVLLMIWELSDGRSRQEDIVMIMKYVELLNAHLTHPDTKKMIEKSKVPEETTNCTRD